MKDRPLREPDQIRRDCAQKLCLVETSRLFHAVLGCLVGEEWTEPHIEELRITLDKSVQARLDGELRFKTFRGAEVHLIRRIHDVAQAAHLDGDEVGYLLGRVAEIKGLQ